MKYFGKTEQEVAMAQIEAAQVLIERYHSDLGYVASFLRKQAAAMEVLGYPQADIDAVRADAQAKADAHYAAKEAEFEARYGA